jgi:hypothetical protein
MKYALINKDAANHILKVQDSAFENISDSNEQVEITMSQAASISSSEEPCFYSEGVIKTMSEMHYIHNLQAVEERIRSKRNSLLSESDWTQMPDSPLSTESKDAWAIYRQELRDITKTIDKNGEVVYPTEPSV